LHAASVAGPGLREPFGNGDDSALLREYLAPPSILLRDASPTRLSDVLGARSSNNLSLEAILGGIQNVTAGPSSSQPDAMTLLLRELEQARSWGDQSSYRSLLQRGLLNGESAGMAPAANNLRDILAQSSEPAPVLPRSADIGALLQQMRRNRRSRESSLNQNFLAS
jgi:hypothetical protein